MLQYELPVPATRGVARGRRGGRGTRIRTRAASTAAGARPGGGWLRVQDDEEFTAPHDFSVRSPGSRQLPARNSDPIHYFFLMFTVATMRIVLRNTREYATRLLIEKAGWIAQHPGSRMRRWSLDGITLESLKRYIGLCINMGLIRKKNIEEYWSKKNPCQATPFFAFVMPFRKFAMMQRFLHVGAMDTPARGQPGFDPWSKVRPVLDAVNVTFKKHYVAPRYLSIDESMVGMKNRVIFLQYMPNKRHSRFGIKKFELCDSMTGYVMHVELYAGKDFPIRSDMGQAHGVVMDLMRKANVLDKGYHLFTDNFYTKPALAETLLGARTLLTGTVRGNSKGLPPLPTKMNIGEMLSYRRQGILLVAFREKKSQRKPVLMLSTATAAGMVQVRTGAGVLKQKPKCIAAYNKYMGGVDISDRKIYHVSAERPSKRYWKKLFFNLIDMALLNSYELYKTNTDGNQCKSRHDYMCSVVQSLCAAEDPAMAVLPPAVPLVGRHELEHLPGKRERNCVVCSDRAMGVRKRSSFWCPGCDDGVHRQCFHKLDHKRPR